MGVVVDPKKPVGVAVGPKNPVGVAVDSKNTVDIEIFRAYCSNLEIFPKSKPPQFAKKSWPAVLEEETQELHVGPGLLSEPTKKTYWSKMTANDEKVLEKPNLGFY